jgi:hypothetical protein
MNRNMRDNRMRDGYDRIDDERNPYGSRGGYVTSRRGDRMYDDEYDRDMRRGRNDRTYDRMDDEYGRDGRHIRFRGSMDSAEYDERYYDGRMDRRGGRRDYDDFYGGHGKGMLSNHELREWQNMLCEDMDPQECEMFKFESVIQQAKQMAVDFNKFTEEEFYTTVLMMFTDYCETVGPNIPMYLALAKNFLEDKDARVKYGEKLAAYHDAIADV